MPFARVLPFAGNREYQSAVIASSSHILLLAVLARLRPIYCAICDVRDLQTKFFQSAHAGQVVSGQGQRKRLIDVAQSMHHLLPNRPGRPCLAKSPFVQFAHRLRNGVAATTGNIGTYFSSLSMLLLHFFRLARAAAI